MAYTKKKYRDDVIDLGAAYGMEIKTGHKHIDNAVQRAIDEVMRKVFPKRPWTLDKTATLSDGDPLPLDYIGYTVAYILDGSNNRTDLRYATVPIIPAMKNNTAAKATAIDPAFWLHDRAFHTWPAAIANVRLDYVAKPIQLYDPQTPIPDTTQSNVPNDCDGLVVRGAFERLASLFVDEPDALQITQEKLTEIIEDNRSYYFEHLAVLLGGSQ